MSDPANDTPPDSQPSPPIDDLPAINFWPNDVAIVSIRDARRRLKLADGIQNDLRQLAEGIVSLRREALEIAGTFEVDALSDPDRMEALLTNTPPPSEWGNEWVGDLIWPGELYNHPSGFQALSRVSGYCGLSPKEVGEVMDMMGSASHSALAGNARDLLPRIQEVIGDLWSAAGEYQHLRDNIAGRLDRMQAEQEFGEQLINIEQEGEPPPASQSAAIPVAMGDNEITLTRAEMNALRAENLAKRLSEEEGNPLGNATDSEVFEWMTEHLANERVKALLPTSFAAYQQARVRGRRKQGTRKNDHRPRRERVSFGNLM